MVTVDSTAAKLLAGFCVFIGIFIAIGQVRGSRLCSQAGGASSARYGPVPDSLRCPLQIMMHLRYYNEPRLQVRQL